MVENTNLALKEPSLDHFYFSCLEYEKLVCSKRKNSMTPGLIELNGLTMNGMSPFDSTSVGQALEGISKSNKTFLNINSITYGNLNDFSQGLVSFVRFLKDQLGEQLASAEQKAILDFCSELVNNGFKALDERSKELVQSFLYWSLKKSDIKEVEIGDRPPVGIFTPRRAPSSQSDSSNRRGPSSGGSRPSRGGDRDRGHAKHQRKRPERGGRGEPREPRKTEISEADLLKEIIAGADKLRQDEGCDKVALKPQNSYNRRRQHKLISDEGLNSSSEGDGDQRHVVIIP